MVKETRIVFGLEDVVAVTIVCRQCEREVAQRLDSAPRSLPQNCPWCGAAWDQAEIDREGIQYLMRILHHFPRQPDSGVTVRLELIADVGRVEGS